MNRKKYDVLIKVKQFYTIIILFLLTSCHFINSAEKIEIFLPPSIPEIPEGGNFFWQLNYRGSGNIEKKLTIHREVRSLTALVDKGLIQPFALWGVIKGINSNRIVVFPAGFIYSISEKSGGTYSFDWNSGFESQLLLQLMDHIDIEKINVRRLLSSVSMVSGNSNHWIIDGEAIIENMISGEFRVYDIRKRRERILSLMLPEGTWFNTNSMCSNIESSGESLAVDVSLWTGYSIFYNESGAVLEVDLESNGDFDYIVY